MARSMLWSILVLASIFGAVQLTAGQIAASPARGADTRSLPCGGGISVSMVVDTTSSMSRPLRLVKKHALRIVDSLRRTPGHHVHNYVAVPLNEPVTGTSMTTTNPRNFNKYLSTLSAFGGGDCEEYMLTALLKAIDKSCPKSTIYVFSDSAPKDQDLLGTVLERLQDKQQHVVFILTGRCGSTNSPPYNAVKAIAATSGGQIFWTSGGGVGPVLNYMRMTYKAQPQVLLAWQLHTPPKDTAVSGMSLSVAVDSSVASVSAFVSCVDGTPTTSLVPPEGSTRVGRQWTKNLGNIVMAHVDEPAMGQWSVSLRSSSECIVRVVGSSTIDLTAVFRLAEPDVPRAREASAQADSNIEQVVLAEIEGAAAEQSTRPTRGDGIDVWITTRNLPLTGLGRVTLVGVNGSELSAFELGEPGLDINQVERRLGHVIVPAENFYLRYTGQYQGATLIRYSTSAVWPRPPRNSTGLTINAAHPVARTQVCGALRATCSITGHDGEVVPSVWMHGRQPLAPSSRVSLVGETTRTLQINPVYKSDMGVYTCTPARPSGQLSSGFLQVVVDGSGNGPCMPATRITWHSRQCLFMQCTLPMQALHDNAISWQRNTQQVSHDNRNVFTFRNGTLIYCSSASDNLCAELSGEFTCRGTMRETGEGVVRTAALPAVCDGNDGGSETPGGGRPQRPDACAVGRHTCHSMARCYPTLRSYTCRCNPGYTGDGRRCTTVSCQFPSNPDNGVVMISGGLTVGAMISYTCHAGYNMIGDGQQTCGDDGHWSGIAPQCIAVQQTQPPTRAPELPSFIRILAAEPKIRVTAAGCRVLQCRVEGRTNPMVDWSKDRQRLHMASGTQQLSDGSLRLCPFVPRVHNGDYRCLARNAEGQMDQRSFLINSPVVEEPVPTQEVVPSVAPSTVAAARHCPVLIPPLNGHISKTNGRDSGSIAQYHCNTQYILEGGDASRQCDDLTLLWTGQAPQCVEVVEEPLTEAPTQAPTPSPVIVQITTARPSATCVKLTCHVRNPRFQASLYWTHSKTYPVSSDMAIGSATKLQTGGPYSVTLEDRSLQVCNGGDRETGEYCCVLNLAGQRYDRCVRTSLSDLEPLPPSSLGGGSECSVQRSACEAQRATCEIQLSEYKQFLSRIRNGQ